MLLYTPLLAAEEMKYMCPYPHGDDPDYYGLVTINLEKNTIGWDNENPILHRFGNYFMWSHVFDEAIQSYIFNIRREVLWQSAISIRDNINKDPNYSNLNRYQCRKVED